MRDANDAQPAGAATRLVQLLLIPLLLFFANWLPRVVALDVFVTADESNWLQRAVNFASALTRQSWAETFQYEHPAVTILWLGAVGVLQQMPGFVQKVLADPEPYQQGSYLWTVPELGITPLQLLVAGRWWVILAISLTTTAAYFPLRRLVGTTVAVVGLLFIAWSPMAVGFARQLQPDGLVASTIFASLTFFLSWLYGGRRVRDLVSSGILMGLGWLTKTPAGFLAPAGAILIAIELIRPFLRRGQPAAGSSSGVIWRPLLLGYVIWGVVATATFFILWPAMWVDPLGTFVKMYMRMAEYSTGHTNPNYFLGQALRDPGPIFYPIAYLFRSTPAVLVGLVAAVVAAWRRYTPLDRTEARQAGLGLLIFALVFTGLMTIIGKKFDRYLLPAFLPLDILSAMGWVAMAHWLARWTQQRFAALALEKLAATVRRPAGGPSSRRRCSFWRSPLHGIFTARTYPYYMTYFNPLLGGNRVAEKAMFVGWGEGLEEAAAWLNQQPDADNLHVIAWYADGPLSFFFQGEAISVVHGSRMPWLDVDYVVLYINQIQRNIPTKTVIDYFLGQKPVFEAARDGFVLARVYDMHAILAQLAATAPPVQDVQVTMQWPDLELLGVRTLPAAAIPAALPVRLNFAGNVDGERKVSLRLSSTDGTLVAQRDVPLAEEVEVQLYVPPDALPGLYDLQLMVYDDATLEPTRTEAGADLVTLTQLEVGENKP